MKLPNHETNMLDVSSTEKVMLKGTLARKMVVQVREPVHQLELTDEPRTL
jgi:hypothetical protein